jgi:N-acetyl-anhydromuramyl-L-alanine amidase AmpD
MKYLEKPYVNRVDGPYPSTSSREGHNISAVTLHYTVGGSALGSLQWNQRPEVKACAHFYVDRDGTVYQLVPLDLRAWHHGQSEFEYGVGSVLRSATDVCSIGIEIANCGPVVRGDNGALFYGATKLKQRQDGVYEFDVESAVFKYKRADPEPATLRFNNGIEIYSMWEPYTKEAIQAVTTLVCDLVAEFSIPLDRIVGHEDVATPLGKRKFDPGPLWPWKHFIKGVQSATGATLPGNIWRLHKTVKP